MWKFCFAVIFVWKVGVILCDSSSLGTISASSQQTTASDVSTSPYSVIEMTLTISISSSTSNSSAAHGIQPTPTAVQQGQQTVGQQGQQTIGQQGQQTIGQQGQQTIGQQGQQTISQAINQSSTEATTIACAHVDWETPSVACADQQCVEEQIENLAEKSKCMKEKPQNVTLSSMDIPELIMNHGLTLAKTIKQQLDSGSDVNMTAVIVTDWMAMEVGVLDSTFLNATSLEFLTFPNYSDKAFTGKWGSMGVTVQLPVDQLPNTGKTVYSVAILPDLLGEQCLERDEMDWDDNLVAQSGISELFVVGDKLLTRKKGATKCINSHVLSISFEHGNTAVEGPLKKPAIITLKHIKSEDYSEPICVYWDDKAWSKKGCKVRETSDTETVCECSHFSSFALVMTQKEKIDDSARRMVVTVASVLGAFSMLGLLICIIVAILVNYHNMDNMRIALNMDVSLLLSQLVFFIGLSTSDNLFYSKPSVCEVIGPFVHLFELAALTWLLMEGFYYYSTLKPFFNEKNTVPIVFYFAMGWGIPIAFASACAEYAYPHFGDPETSEFCWLFIRGGEAWFFGAPVLILVLLNIGIRACILKEVVCWKEDPDDIKIERAKTRLMTSSVMMLVIVLTWVFGVLAVNYTEDKVFHYFFIVFYTFQGLLVFVIYCVRNQEMWDWYKGKKEETEREKKATYNFVYVP